MWSQWDALLHSGTIILMLLNSLICTTSFDDVVYFQILTRNIRLQVIQPQLIFVVNKTMNMNAEWINKANKL